MEKRRIKLIGVPMDLGASRRGVDMGPSAMRIAGVAPRLRELGHEVQDGGNVFVGEPEVEPEGEVTAKFAKEIAGACRRLADLVQSALGEGFTPLVVGGDHSIAMGTVSGIARHFAEQNRRIGLIWLDAHGDINTPESSLSGNVHGMPLAALLGFCGEPLHGAAGGGRAVDVRQVAVVGVRDLDPGEREMFRRSEARVFTMREIDERGMAACMRDAIEIASDGTAGFHVSMDTDFLDPTIAPGVGTPVRGGASYRESHLAMEMIAETGRMIGFEHTELNPVFDEQNQTAALAVGLILSAFGKAIL